MNPQVLNILKELSKSATECGVDLRVVGGFVRDYLLDIDSTDIDLVCNDVDKFVDYFLEHHTMSKLYYETFDGMKDSEKAKKFVRSVSNRFYMKVIEYAGWKIDIVEPRKETYTKDSIKPICEKATFEEDAMRRDYTIGTVQLMLSEDEFLVIYDENKDMQGVKDIRDKILRTPRDPYITFDEDPIRMLRGVRFAAKFNMNFTKETLEAIRNKASDIWRAPAELIQSEIVKGCVYHNYFSILSFVGLMNELFPYVERLKSVPQNPKYHELNAFNHTIEAVHTINGDYKSKIAMLLHDTGKYLAFDPITLKTKGHEKISEDECEEALKKLKFSNKDTEFIKYLVRYHMEYHHLINKSKPLRRYARKHEDYIGYLIVMAKADLSDNPNRTALLKEYDEKAEALWKCQIELGKQFKLNINGYELMALGVPQNVYITIVKKYLERLVVDGNILNVQKDLVGHTKDLIKRYEKNGEMWFDENNLKKDRATLKG